MRINDNGTDRDMTAGEEAVHATATVAIRKEQATRDAIIAANAANLRSAITKLKALGLADAEITVLTGRT